MPSRSYRGRRRQEDSSEEDSDNNSNDRGRRRTKIPSSSKHRKRRGAGRYDEDSSQSSEYSSDEMSRSSSGSSHLRSRSTDESRSAGMSVHTPISGSSADTSRKSLSSESDVDTASEPSVSDGEERFQLTKKPAQYSRPISRQSQKVSANASRLSMAASLALQRRKKESPQLKIALDNRKVREVDYHKNVTAIYCHIEKQEWREVAERCRTHPIETKTWVYRMDKAKKNILWRMLPIHTAILYRAPVYVLLDLINAYPDGPTSADDRKMLPIHMACRIVCKEDVLRLLLKHAPGSVLAEDIKGRTPRDFLGESKRENKSKVLQKVNERNRKNLLKILKEFEHMKEESDYRSRASVSRSRSRHNDDYDNRSRYSSHGDRPSSRLSRSSHRHSKSYGDDDMSHFDRPSSRLSRSSHRHSKSYADDDMSRASRRSRSSRVPRQPRHPDIDESSYVSHRSRSSRVSRSSRTSRVSRSSRLPINDHSPAKSPTKNRQRLPPQPGIRIRHEQVEEDEFTINNKQATIEIHGNRPTSAESAITSPSGDEDIHEKHDRNKNDPDDANEIDDKYEPEEEEDFGDLWLELEEKHPIPEQSVDEGLKSNNARKARKKLVEKEEALSKIKYFDPPKELQKLLVVINSSDADASFNIKKRPSSAASRSSRAPLMPGRDNGTSRRVNACGALKALSKNEKNRLRLGRTKGVVSSLCNALRDPSATVEERIRCSNTLMFLSVPKKNWEAIFNADDELMPTLTMSLQDEDPRVRYNACFCMFLLTKSDYNRYDIISNPSLMSALVDISDIDVGTDTVNDDRSVMSMDDNLSQKYHNLGSPSGIRRQGSPTSDDESKRGSRLCALKAFLSISKLQQGSQVMVHRKDLLDLLFRISGTMTAEENLLCMAIIANLTRDCENITWLNGHHPKLLHVLERGLGSRNIEVQKCASFALQNLSCNKKFRVALSSSEKSSCEKLLTNLAKVGTDVVSDGRYSKNEEGKKSRTVSSSDTAEGQVAAIHAIKNLSIEPSNIVALTGIPGISLSLMSIVIADDSAMEEKEDIDENIRYVASDALATMAQWLNGIAVTCAEKNNLDLEGRPLTSMQVSTWNQWE
jgi:hypothetical protein